MCLLERHPTELGSGGRAGERSCGGSSITAGGRRELLAAGWGACHRQGRAEGLIGAERRSGARGLTERCRGVQDAEASVDVRWGVLRAAGAGLDDH